MGIVGHVKKASVVPLFPAMGYVHSAWIYTSVTRDIQNVLAPVDGRALTGEKRRVLEERMISRCGGDSTVGGEALRGTGNLGRPYARPFRLVN
jgi:hypothetical protein